MTGNLKIILEILPILFSAIAILIACFTYRRQKTFENENLLFKYKLDKYHEILNIIKELFVVIREKIEDIHDVLTDSSDKEDCEAVQYELEMELEKAEMAIFSNSAFLPEQIFNEVDVFLEKLFEADLLKNYNLKKRNDELKKLGELEDLIFGIGEVMRVDLGIDPLNKKLHSRTRDLKYVEEKE